MIPPDRRYERWVICWKSTANDLTYYFQKGWGWTQLQLSATTYLSRSLAEVELDRLQEKDFDSVVLRVEQLIAED